MRRLASGQFAGLGVAGPKLLLELTKPFLEVLDLSLGLGPAAPSRW
jgi:hypothetical protein